MKKIILSIALVISGACLVNVSAQTKTSFGIKAEGNLSNVRLTDLQGASTSFRPGLSLGGFTKIEFNEHFALQPELKLGYTSGNIKYSGMKSKFKYANVELPVYAVGQFAMKNDKFYIGAGPKIGYGFSADSALEKLPEGAPGENKIELDHFYLGAAAMLGYEFRNGIQINAGYSMGFDMSTKSTQSKIKTHVINLGIGYRF